MCFGCGTGTGTVHENAGNKHCSLRTNTRHPLIPFVRRLPANKPTYSGGVLIPEKTSGGRFNCLLEPDPSHASCPIHPRETLPALAGLRREPGTKRSAMDTVYATVHAFRTIGVLEGQLLFWTKSQEKRRGSAQPANSKWQSLRDMSVIAQYVVLRLKC